MKQRIIQPAAILILSTILIIVLCRECGSNYTDTRFIPMFKPVISHSLTNVPVLCEVKGPAAVREVDSVDRWHDAPADSAIKKDWNKARDYDTLMQKDSTAELHIKASLYRNRLHYLKLYGTIHHDSITVIKQVPKYIPEKPRLKAFIGFETGMIKPDKLFVGPKVSLLTKKEHLYNVIIDPFNQVYLGGTEWIIRLKKR